jgi:hypothetical protein
MAKIFFFGYGAYADYYRLKNIIGKGPEGGEGALLEGFNLAVQNLKNIPEGPKKILEKVWGNNFRAYSIIRGNGIVNGKVWLIDEEDLEKIKEYEFINVKESWRELVKVDIKTSDGKIISALTDKSLDQFGTVETVDGLDYKPNLNIEGKKYYSEEDEYKIELTRQAIKQYYGQFINI